MRFRGIGHSYSATYLLANKLIVLVILLTLSYVVVMNYFNIEFSCQYQGLYGKECRSCGITRGLWSCFQLDFISANKFNSRSIYTFVTILMQLFYRFILIAFMGHYQLPNKWLTSLIVIDFLLVAAMFYINLNCYG